jgi:hypothetical protein
MELEPATDDIVVAVEDDGEVTVAGTVDNRLQLRKYRINDGDPPLVELSDEESGFHNNVGLEYTWSQPQGVWTDDLGDVHVVFDMADLSHVLYRSSRTPYHCDLVAGVPQTTLQATEETGQSGTDVRLSAHRWDSLDRSIPVIAYMSGSNVLFSRRVPPIGTTVSVSPARWGVEVGELSRPIFVANTAYYAHTRTTLLVQDAEVLSDPPDQDGWGHQSCRDLMVSIDAPFAHGFIAELSDPPVHSEAELDFTVSRLQAPDELWHESGILVATEVADIDGDCLSDELETATDTDPLDADTDDDGMTDGNCGSEDLNANGEVDPGETDPRNPDTDGDGLWDATERGLTEPETDDTDLSAGHFVPDADPTTTTDPTNPDTDGDGRLDGDEDHNRNGLYEPELGETDPNTADISVLEVDVEFEPGRCPNYLKSNRRSFRFAIVGSNEVDVYQIDPASVRLEGVAPIGSMPWDVATPHPAGQDVCDCTIGGSDGVPDKVLRFESADVIAALGARDGESVVLTLTGNLADGTPFFGRSCASVMIQSPENSVFSGN